MKILTQKLLTLKNLDRNKMNIKNMNILKMLKRVQSASLILLSLTSIIHLNGCAVAAVSGAATGLAVVNDRRCTGAIVEDQSNEFKALKVCLQSKDIWKKSHISAISYNNTLLLVGQTPNESYKQELENDIKKNLKVHTVHNELAIKEPVSMMTRSQDSWITTQIKTKMFGKKGLNPSRVKVITEDGIVYLMGLTTEEEEIKATEIARSTSGVYKVVQIFDRT